MSHQGSTGQSGGWHENGEKLHEKSAQPHLDSHQGGGLETGNEAARMPLSSTI